MRKSSCAQNLDGVTKLIFASKLRNFWSYYHEIDCVNHRNYKQETVEASVYVIATYTHFDLHRTANLLTVNISGLSDNFGELYSF
jgi:hypothetical protein